ncbi:two-component response regulator [Kocuria flava]|uniref:DNA-binding response regulator n=1 Tax=Kocuria flava TaxID=446860 RepID=A0A0U2WP58_9MICC|nr:MULTISPECIES: response regulator transcription factor [Kocuria]ALU38404.1 two-component response regulator [Kocuria flava]MCD1145530.1 response regulator transcription factor [Kocuria sp. LUK]MCJ8506099.1 response regulator transcription factor [Kocuria flava]PLC12064.1 two-component response regulator [Kocuria flava]GEO92887.1 DNA-binding response regulator [Kocuria flava]
MPSTLVAVVDDHEVVREGVRLVSMTSQADVKLVGSASTVPDLLDQLGRDPGNPALTGQGAKRIECEVVLLDLSLNDRSRPSANVEALRAAGMKVLIFSIGENAALIREALRAGALGLVRKSDPLEHAIEEARNIAEGRPVITKELAAAIDGDVEFARANLSPREQETLRLYASGFAQVQVARRMGIKQSAVKTNIDRIREKYARIGRPAPTKIDLRIRAIEDGLVEPTADITTAEKHL